MKNNDYSKSAITVAMIICLIFNSLPSVNASCVMPCDCVGQAHVHIGIQIVGKEINKMTNFEKMSIFLEIADF